MKSLAFPDMLSATTLNTVSDKEATTNNLKLLLKSEKGSLFGDPYFGTSLYQVIYELNNTILKDVIKDQIYNAVTEFMPQLRLSRADIQLIADHENLTASLVAQNLIDGSIDLYTIRLIDEEDIRR